MEYEALKGTWSIRILHKGLYGVKLGEKVSFDHIFQTVLWKKQQHAWYMNMVYGLVWPTFRRVTMGTVSSQQASATACNENECMQRLQQRKPDPVIWRKIEDRCGQWILQTDASIFLSLLWIKQIAEIIHEISSQTLWQTSP